MELLVQRNAKALNFVTPPGIRWPQAPEIEAARGAAAARKPRRLTVARLRTETT
jgi:hypothetical protein